MSNSHPSRAMAFTAVIGGSFLSGAMLSLSLCAVPVLLSTATSASHLATQWSFLYHHGHILMPSLAVLTASMYGYAALGWRNAAPALDASPVKGAHVKMVEKQWRTYAAAGLATVSIIPFTLAVMVPTNNVLFRIEEGLKTGAARVELEEVKALVVRWAWMHVARSMLPLLGAVVGCSALLEEVRA